LFSQNHFAKSKKSGKLPIATQMLVQISNEFVNDFIAECNLASTKFDAALGTIGIQTGAITRNECRLFFAAHNGEMPESGHDLL
jgi:hypothetical protein